MMNFSNIKEIKIKNFRCLDELTIKFENSPIVALVAGNDSGKSSAVKAIQAAIYNDEKDTKSYIRTGTKGFKINIIFEDGIRIERVKTLSGNTYTLYNPDGAIKQTWDRMTQDMPDEVKAIFGVKIEDVTGELLNLRTCESLLLFSLTKTTDNYKIVHSCISSELIEHTYAIGNGRIKEIEKTIAKSETLRNEMYEQAKKIQTISEESLNKIITDNQQIQNMINIEQQIFDCCLSKIEYDEKQTKILNPDKLQALFNSKFSEKDIETLTVLEQLKKDLLTINIKEQALKTNKIEALSKQRIDATEIDKLCLLEQYKALSNIIQQKEKQIVKTNILNELTKLQEQVNDLSANLVIMTDLINIIDKQKEKEKQQMQIQLNLNDLINTLKTNKPVRYDIDKNALVKNCEHCNAEVYFELKDLDFI